MISNSSAIRATLLLACSAPALLIAGAPAHAAQAIAAAQTADASEPNAANVDATSIPTATATDENPGTIVVTARRSTRSSVSLGAAEIQDILPGVNPVKAIQSLPGVVFETADPWGNNEQNISVFVHGFNQNQLGFTFDGVPLGDQNYGNYNGLTPQRAVISENVSQVTLASGAAGLGVASGSNLGGAIETVSSDPTRSFGVQAAQTLGSYDAQRTFVRIDSGSFRALGGDTRFYASAVRQHARAWEFDSIQGGYQVNGKLVHENGRATVTLYFDYSDKVEPNQDSVAHNAGGIEPYYRTALYPDFAAALNYVSATGAPPANAPANYLNYYGDAQRTDYLGYAKLEYRFSDAVKAWVQGYYHHDYGQGQISGPIAVAGLPALFATYYPGQNLKQVFGNSGYALRTTEYGIDRGGALGAVDVTLGRHEIEAGLWYEHNFNSIRRRWYAFPIDNPATPYDRADPALRRLTQYGVDVSYDIVQPHLQDNWHATDRLTFQAGFKSSLQFDHGTVPVQPLPGALPGLSTGLPSGDIDTKRWFLPAVGAVWDVDTHEQLFANAQKNMRQFQATVSAGLSPYGLGSQQAFDSFKANTAPETSWTYEFGLRSHRQIDTGWLTGFEGQINYYHIDFSNRLLQVSATPIISSVLGGVAIINNVGGVTTNGVDVAGTLHFGRHFLVYNAASFNSTTYDSDYTTGTTVVPTGGKYVPDVPKWLDKLIVKTNWGPFEAQVFGDYVGKRFATYTNDQSIPGRVLVSLQASYQLPAMTRIGLKSAKLSVNVTNLTQHSGPYELVVGPPSKTYNTYATPPRMAFVTLSAGF